MQSMSVFGSNLVFPAQVHLYLALEITQALASHKSIKSFEVCLAEQRAAKNTS